MSKKVHWRLHCWDSLAACKRSNGVSYHGIAKPWVELSDSWDNVNCKACFKYIAKATR